LVNNFRAKVFPLGFLTLALNKYSPPSLIYFLSLQYGIQIQMTKDFLVGGLSNIPRSSLAIKLLCIIVLNLNTQLTAKTNMSIDIVISVTEPTPKGGLAVENALKIWERVGRDEKLAALMKSMHKNGVGFKEVEEAVANIQFLKFGNGTTKGGGGGNSWALYRR
jgi:hypothetical protein